MKCPHCDSERIESGIEWRQHGDTGAMGLSYKKAKVFLQCATVYSDLCLDCGTVVRTYIKDSTDKDWNKGRDSIF